MYPSLHRVAQNAPSAYDVPQSVVSTLVKLSVPQGTARTAGVRGGPTIATHTWEQTGGSPPLCISQPPLVFLGARTQVPSRAHKNRTFCQLRTPAHYPTNQQAGWGARLWPHMAYNAATLGLF